MIRQSRFPFPGRFPDHSDGLRIKDRHEYRYPPRYGVIDQKKQPPFIFTWPTMQVPGGKKVGYILRAAITSVPILSAPRTVKGRLADFCVGAGGADGY